MVSSSSDEWYLVAERAVGWGGAGEGEGDSDFRNCSTGDNDDLWARDAATAGMNP